MNNKDVFEKEIKDIPFIELIDKGELSKQFSNAGLKPCFELYLRGNIGEDELKKLENDHLEQRGDYSKYEEVVRNYTTKFNDLIISSTLPIEFYINDVKQTGIYKKLKEVDEVYCDFLKRISNNHSKGSFGLSLENVHNKENQFDRYKEAEITANRIIQILSYFDNQSQKNIIDYIANDTSIKRDLLMWREADSSEVKGIETIFRTYLVKEFEKNSHYSKDEDYLDDFSDSVPLERMIILEKLGIIDYIQSLQVDDKNEKQTALMLSSFTGINASTIAKNLGVMLGHKKNDSDPNSPYKNSKNNHKANDKLKSFIINRENIYKKQ